MIRSLIFLAVCFYARANASTQAYLSFNEYDDNGTCYQVDVHVDDKSHGLVKYITECSTGINVPSILIESFVSNTTYQCPDNSTQVMVFAPNYNYIEQNVSVDVYTAAVYAGYKSVSLLMQDATKAAFLNYSRCPGLLAIFYDGDADPESITAVDGLIYYTDIEQLDWSYQVVAYWLACEAYQSPMLDAVTTAKPRRWAAGVNDLEVGSSDYAAGAAMKAAFAHAGLQGSFNSAVKKYDNKMDIWGFGGFGSNQLEGNLGSP